MKVPPPRVPVPADLAVVAAALSMTAEAFAAAHRGLFLVHARIVATDGHATARATPSTRSAADETAPWVGPDEASRCVALPGASAVARLPLSLGRSPEADLVLLHPTVSRRHAAVWPGEGFIEVCDLGSQHGTYAGSRRLDRGERAVISLGERVRFADVELTLTDAGTVWRALHREPARE